MTTEQWPEMPGKLYRDGSEIPAGYLSAILPHIRETGGRVLFPKPEPPEEDHPEGCGCPECRDDARDTADASREGEGL